jgi:hypothetical protein
MELVGGVRYEREKEICHACTNAMPCHGQPSFFPNTREQEKVPMVIED